NFLKGLPDRLTGPKVARRRVLDAHSLWGLVVKEPRSRKAAGVTIRSVFGGSPADAAGLKAGDILKTLDGRWTTSVADTYTAAASVPPGRSVEIVVERDGGELTLTVTPKDGI